MCIDSVTLRENPCSNKIIRKIRSIRAEFSKSIGQHSCSKMLLGTHRVAATTSSDCNRLFLRKKTKRSTPVTSDERAWRNRFKLIVQAINARRKDLSHVAEDLAAFNAQKDTAGGYKTMRQYLWHVCAAEING